MQRRKWRQFQIKQKKMRIKTRQIASQWEGGGRGGIEIHFFEYHWEKLQTCSIEKRWKEIKDKLANQIIIQNQQKYSFWHTLSHTHPSNPTEGIKKKEIFIISGCVTQSDTHTHTLLYV
jgi:hypothetical protein